MKRLFFAPVRHTLRPREQKHLETSEPFDIVVNNKKIKCWKWGQGPGILLAHGWNGKGVQLHRFIKPLLEKGYSVIAFDAPGHGASEGKTSSYFEYSDAVRHLLRSRRDLHIKGAIAHSFGAAAVLNGMHKECYSLEVALVSPALKLFKIFNNMFLSAGVPAPLLQSLIHDYEKEFGYNLKTDEPFRLLSQIPSGMLIVHDKEDETVPYADSADADRRFQKVRLHPTRGLGHKQILYHPLSIELITGYLHTNIQRNAARKPAVTPLKSADILAEYKASDFEKRLYLFLECPELRADFIEADQQAVRYGT